MYLALYSSRVRSSDLLGGRLDFDANHQLGMRAKNSACILTWFPGVFHIHQPSFAADHVQMVAVADVRLGNNSRPSSLLATRFKLKLWEIVVARHEHPSYYAVKSLTRHLASLDGTKPLIRVAQQSLQQSQATVRLKCGALSRLDRANVLSYVIHANW